MRIHLNRQALAAALTLSAAAMVSAADWPMWGYGPSRNMVSAETNLVTEFDPGQFVGNTEEIDMATTKNVRWVAKLGSQAYGNPVVAGGKVFVGTNNEAPRDPRIKGDRGVVMCFDEKTGKFLWQLAVPKLGTGKVSDWEFLGICSSPAVEGNRLWIVSNRCEVLCLDTEGMANGNDGPYKDEAKYMQAAGSPPVTPGPQDADIIWRFDMREELGVFPHNITNCGPLVVGDLVVVTTSNGVDWTHTSIPNPKAPALAVLNKNTGELISEEASGVSARTLHSNWSSAAFGVAGGQEMIVFGGGDGICYGYDTKPVKDAEGINILKELWRFDCNPEHYRMKGGKPLKYATPEGPSEVIATPVFVNERVYVPIGQDPEHGEGLGYMVCIDPTKRGDITKTGLVWGYDKIQRSLSTPAIKDGLLFVGDYSGFVHCLDAATGKPHWVYDTKSHIWGSAMLADGKVHLGTEDGDFIIFEAKPTLKVVAKVDMRSPVYNSPIAAGGTIFLATHTHLYALAKTN